MAGVRAAPVPSVPSNPPLAELDIKLLPVTLPPESAVKPEYPVRVVLAVNTATWGLAGVPDVITVPLPAGTAQVPSPRQNEVLDAPVPLARLVTGRFPVTSAARFTAPKLGFPAAFP